MSLNSVAQSGQQGKGEAPHLLELPWALILTMGVGSPPLRQATAEKIGEQRLMTTVKGGH